MMYQFAQLRLQGIKDPAHSMMNKGGGSAPSNPDTRYANLDALYGTQNQASQFMLNNAMPYIPTLTQNSAGMVQEAMDGTLANQLAQRAGNDAAATMGSALDANNRNMQRYGMGVSANRLLSEGNRNAIMGAGMKAGEMNKARLGAEDMKWNRNANFYGQVMGMNNGAMQGMSNAGAGLSNIANQQSANDRANAAGYGQAGAAFSNALFKADGGIIEGKAARLADGGNAWEAYKAANPVRPMVSGGSSGSGRTNPYAAMLSGAAPTMLGAGLRDIMNLDGKGGKIAKGVKEAWSKGKDLVNQYQAAQQAPSSTGLEFETNPDVVAGNVDAANAATEMGVSAMDAATSATAAADAGSAIGAASDVAAGADYMAAGTQAADAGGAAADWSSAIWAANGGYIPDRKKGRGLRLAMGGMPTIQKMSVADNSGVSGLDSNQSMSVARMDEAPKMYGAALSKSSKLAESQTHANASPVAVEQKDPIAQAVKGQVARQAATAAVAEAAGAGSGAAAGTGAGLAAGTGAGVTAGAAGTGAGLAAGTGAGVTAGTAGGVAAGVGGGAATGAAAGSVVPVVGTIVGAAVGALASQYLSKGGEARIDHTPGGEVSGPGTETSDDIPAWLSDGEYVLNAEAVKMVGKKKLDKINKAGLKKRGDEDAKPGLKDANVALGSGGFANLGIALGAGVDQMYRQQMIDQRNQELEMRKQEAEQRRQEYEYQRQQREANAQAQAGARSAMEDATAMAGLPEQLRNRTDLTPEEKANAIRAYRDAGYTPEALAKKAGLELGRVDIGKGMELQNKLIAQQQAERRARVGGLLGAGDYAGLADVMSNNDFNPDGKAYKFNGVEKAKDGNEYVNFDIDGAKQRVDKRMLPGLVEAALDPTKGIEYTREVGKITDQDADRKLREKQIGISGGHLGLAQRKYNDEMAQEKVIRDLRTKLSRTTDAAERAAIQQQISDLVPSANGAQNRYFTSPYEYLDDDGTTVRKGLARVDRQTGDTVDVTPGKAAKKSAPVRVTKSEMDAEWNSRGKNHFKSRSDFESAMKAKGFVVE